MSIETTIEELDRLSSELKEKKNEIIKHLGEINARISQINKKKSNMIDAHKKAQQVLNGYSIESLQNELSNMLRYYKEIGGLEFFYGTNEIDIERLIQEKVFLNKMIELIGGKNIMFLKISKGRKELISKSKQVASQKKVSRKMKNKILVDMVQEYLIHDC